MQLQENGLPIGAEFVGVLSPKKGQYILQGGDCEIATHDWEYYTKVIIRFPTYGTPLEQVDLKGRKLLGGSMTTAWRVPCVGAEFINVSGHIEVCTYDVDDSYRLCLEPLPKKKRVLVLELPIDEHGNVKVQDGPMPFHHSTSRADWVVKYGGGTIKEVDDVA